MRTLLTLIVLLIATQAKAIDGHGCHGPAYPYNCPGGWHNTWVPTDSIIPVDLTQGAEFDLELDASGYAGYTTAYGLRFQGWYPVHYVECVSIQAGPQLLADNPGTQVNYGCSPDNDGDGWGYWNADAFTFAPFFIDEPSAQLRLRFRVKPGAWYGMAWVETTDVSVLRNPTPHTTSAVGESVFLTVVPEPSGGLMLAAGLPVLVMMGRRRRG